MKKTLIVFAAFGFFAVGCEQPDPTTPSPDGLGLAPQANTGPVIHHASLGGADICEALGQPTGCDANFSLVANSYADGSVKGQWQDSFGGGSGIHVAVDCLNVIGNGAVVGGVITHGFGTCFGGPCQDFEGERALTAVVDNGTSANDPADQLSFSFFPVGDLTCDLFVPGDFPLFDLAHGQVKVW